MYTFMVFQLQIGKVIAEDMGICIITIMVCATPRIIPTPPAETLLPRCTLAVS